MARIFDLKGHHTTLTRELAGGLTTFLAMAYILFVNSAILADAGMDRPAVFAATALAAAAGCLAMGLLANYPIALAPGMGINAFFAYTVVLTMGIPWQTALAGTFISGVLFFILAVTGLRQMLIAAIPQSLKTAIGAALGLFIAFVGLINAGIIVGNEATLVHLGDLDEAETLLAIFGVVVTSLFLIRQLRGAVFFGMMATAMVGVITGLIPRPEQIVGPLPSLAPTFGQAILHIPEVLTWQMLAVVLTFLFVDFFDTAGTLIAVGQQSGFMRNGRLPRTGRALAADSLATMIGALLGTSTTTSYIESTTGIAIGARTGLASVVVAGLFVLSLFFSPLLTVVTPAVTAPALILVGVMLMSSIAEIDWKDQGVAIPCFVVLITMPLTFSIATGIALGLVMHTLLQLFQGRYRQIHPIMYALSLCSLGYLVWLVD